MRTVAEIDREIAAARRNSDFVAVGRLTAERHDAAVNRPGTGNGTDLFNDLFGQVPGFAQVFNTGAEKDDE